MAVIDDLQTTKANLVAQLAADSVTPSMDYSIDGQSVSRTSWRQSLIDRIKELNELIQIEGGPFELRTQAVT